MRDDHHRFLTLLGQLPARLNAEQAAWVLNCQPHDVPILVSVRLLKPLGNPRPNRVKYFATNGHEETRMQKVERVVPNALVWETSEKRLGDKSLHLY